MNDALNIIVTGASKGIGFELTKYFLKEGHNVYAVSRSIDQLKELKVSHSKLTIVQMDITKDLSIITSLLVNQKIHHLINNAGCLINKPITELSDEDIINQYKVNVIAPLRLTRDLLPFMEAGSAICNISSMGGVQGSAKFPGLSAYSSSKGALSILTECIAEELSDKGVRCNALALGAVQTEMLANAFPDYKAPFTPAEMANYIGGFVLKASRFYNGKVLPVSASTP